MLQLVGPDGHPLPDPMTIVSDLDTGVLNHLAWFKQAHRALVCNAETHADDLVEDAHCRCDFGRWYHREQGHAQWSETTAFKVIGELHQGMHDLARLLLQQKVAGQPIASSDYDRFMEQTVAFRLSIRHLQGQVMESLFLVDHLTGAWNRQGLYVRLAEEQERMVRSGEACCLCMMDLDHFKVVNDTHGHPAGDEVLRATAQLISNCLRKYDGLFRYAGEKFLIFMPRTQLDHAAGVLERLRAQLAAHSFGLSDGTTVSVTASFGVAPMRPMEIQDVLESADYALLCAKSRGRNQVCVWGR